jgi:hypothetical protein
MAGPWSTRLWEIFVQLESVFGTSPGALAGTDAMKVRTQHPFTRNVARYDRDKDQGNQASVLSTQKGKESSAWTVASDLIPSGNAATPTEPDIDVFLEAHMGSKHKATAHTTLAAGSSTTILNFTPGGVAASGTQVGDIIVVDVSAAFGLEARQVTAIATDAVTVDRALSAAPAAARAVYTGTTYKLLASALKTVHIWQFLDGDNFRHKVGGASVKTMAISCDFSSETPVAEVTFTGEGKQVETATTARPTSVTAGEPLLPAEAKVWIGASGVICVTSVGVDSDNGLELRMNESCSLFPTGQKRTGNGGNFNITQSISLLLQTAYEGYYDVADDLTAYDVIVQLGVSPGKIVAWRTPKWILDANPGDQDGEVKLDLTGRAYALTTVNTELTFFVG